MTVTRINVDVPIGTVLDFAGSAIPSGYLECDGSAVSRTAYAKLFAAIGTAWGAGNGSTTFNLPNLGGRACIGKGSRAVGATGGSESESYTPAGSIGGHALTASEIPKHTHPVPSHTHTVGGGITSSGSCTISSSGGHSHTVHAKYTPKAAASGTAVPIFRASGTNNIDTMATIDDNTGNHTHSVPNHTHTHNITVTGGATTASEQDSGGGSHNHGFTGTQASIGHMQPYAVVRKIIRAE